MKQEENNYLKQWKAIVDAKDIHKALIDHFRYLADTPGFEPLLEAVMNHAKSVTVNEDKLIIDFLNGKRLTATPPPDLNDYENWPKSFRSLASVHDELTFPNDGGWCLVLGDHGNFESEFLDESEAEEFSNGVRSPIRDYSDWYLYHPKKINVYGEPGLCFFSHEGGNMDAPTEINAGSLFLKRMSAIMEIDVLIPGAAPISITLEALDTHDIVDPSAKRDHVHFAVSYNLNYLYTIQEDEILSVWTLSDSLVPKRAGQTKLPNCFPTFYNSNYQFTDSRLILWQSKRMTIIDISRPATPQVITFLNEGYDCWFAVEDILYFEDRKQGYGIWQPPTKNTPEPIIKIVLPLKERMFSSSFATMLGDCVCWATQGGLVLTKFSTPTIVASLSLNNVVAYPLPVSDTRLAVFEIYDDEQNALVFVDFDGKKLNKVATFRSREIVRGWCLSGNELYVVIRSSKKLGDKGDFATALVIFDTTTATEVASIPLPFIEVIENHTYDTTKVVWLGVKDSICALLLGNGKLHRFNLRK